jgi:peptidoglycan/xylan/chitin deacetylase (PgdA/CDA1 family)
MFKEIYANAVSIFCNDDISKIDKTVFLMFHSIEDDFFEKKSIYHMSLFRFKEICKLLDDIRIEAFNVYGNSIDFIFTFDDGYRNYADNALPVLANYSFKSIVFLIAEHLNDKSGKYININVLKTIFKLKGVSIGMHGYSHVDLSSLSDVNLKDELAKIKKVCDTADIDTSYFSLPFGKADDNVIAKLQKEGYKDIFTSDYGFKVSSKNGKFVYPRIDIWANDSNHVIKQKIMKQWRLFFIIESYRSKLYRVK